MRCYLGAFLVLTAPAWAAPPDIVQRDNPGAPRNGSSIPGPARPGCISSSSRTQCFIVPDGESQRQVFDTASSFRMAQVPTQYVQSPTNMPPAGAWVIIGKR